MDFNRSVFTQPIVDFVENLPPLLQFLLGVFIFVLLLRGFMKVVDIIEDWREGKS